MAIAVGRRIVLLVATAIMLVGAILCALATNFDWHLGTRMLIGFAAGQSEALVPMITQVR
jgi:predicted MFS family arabinose efflux permease